MARKVKLLIESKGNLLVLKPLKRKKYTLVGGAVEQFETPIEAGIREGFEEIGLTLSSSDFSTYFSAISNRKKKTFQFFCYLLRKDDLVFELKEKHKFQSVQWVPVHRAIEQLKGLEKCGADFFYSLLVDNEKSKTALKQTI